jgi:MarR family transcriptional regulator for hemolysin
LPVWLVLVNLKANPRANQRGIAEAMGVSEATLTHHLNGLDADGLITRRRDPSNRRVHLVELTEAGEAAFVRLRATALAFDRRLRRGISDDEVEQFRSLLDRLADNVGTELPGTRPWAGLADAPVTRPR